MSPWPGKYVIGLTGNIAAGKSVIRRMLEHLGAYGIDADALGHRAFAPGAPGYPPVVDTFGRWILDANGQVDRARLGRLVFSDPAALEKLEEIIHPLVRRAIAILAQRARQKVIAIEAIKLLEGDLHLSCDSIWVVHADAEIRLRRLMEKRGVSEPEARSRIEAQGRPEDKLAVAGILIRNERSFENTWAQVSAAWTKLFPADDTEPLPVQAEPGELAVQRARPSQADQIAQLIARLSQGRRRMTRGDVIAEFGEKAFMLLLRGRRAVGLLGWQVENLVSRSTDFYLEDGVPLVEAARLLVEGMEIASGELQSEASLLFLPKAFAAQDAVWGELGYKKCTVETLSVRAWQEAARESYVQGADLFFKRLRVDRILRPI